MAAKELRVVQDAKFTGVFTRQQIERAIRVVEGEPTTNPNRRETRGTSRTRKHVAGAKQ